MCCNLFSKNPESGDEFGILEEKSGIQGMESRIRGVESGIQGVESGIQGMESETKKDYLTCTHERIMLGSNENETP